MTKRVLISTQVFPPMCSGSAIILYELLRHLPCEELVAVHGTSDPPLMGNGDLGIERHLVLLWGSYKWSLRCARRCPELYVPLIRRRLIQLAKQHRVERIYAHFPNSPFLIAAWQAAEKLGLPLTVYFDILWEETYGREVRLAQKCENRIVRRADSRFAITEFAAEYLTKKHGVPVAFLPHTIDVRNAVACFQPLADETKPTIHFCGGIYPRMNQDAVLRLADAATIARSRPALDWFSPALPAELQARGYQPRYLPRDELRAAQRRSTILYLPQAFASAQPTMIHYNFPTKAMEYLCSGRPILVHAPPDCYLTWLAKREGFALVVDRPEVGALAAAIDQLVGDQDLQEELVSKALRFVPTRDSRKWAATLWSALSGRN